MCKKHDQDVDSLILGVRTILSKDRCPFSEEEKALLNNIISYLDNSKKLGDKSPIDLISLSKVIEILIKVFCDLDNFL